MASPRGRRQLPLTSVRQKKIASFMELYAEDPQGYPPFKSDAWIRQLIKSLGGPKFHLPTVANVKLWISSSPDLFAVQSDPEAGSSSDPDIVMGGMQHLLTSPPVSATASGVSQEDHSPFTAASSLEAEEQNSVDGEQSLFDLMEEWIERENLAPTFPLSPEMLSPIPSPASTPLDSSQSSVAPDEVQEGFEAMDTE